MLDHMHQIEALVRRIGELQRMRRRRLHLALAFASTFVPTCAAGAILIFYL